MKNSWQIVFVIQLLILGCTGHEHHSAKFVSVPIPEIDGDQIVQKSSQLKIDNNEVEMKGNILISAGDTKGDTYGAVVSLGGERIHTFGNKSFLTKGAPYLSNNIDFTSLIQKNDRIYSISHSEDVPGNTFLLNISQNSETGELTVDNVHVMDWTALKGVWSPCAGSVSPWNTHLGAEEYEPDSADIWDQSDFDTAYESDEWDEHVGAQLQYAMRFWNVYPDLPINKSLWDHAQYLSDAKLSFFPYAYGYTFEIALDDYGKYSMWKHYSMGRRSGELAIVLPDKKTTYLTDDGTNVYLSVYVADKKSDLTAGTLYCAKMTQVSDKNNGEFDIEWIDMGHATDEEIESEIQSAKFEDMFSRLPPVNDSYPIVCPDDYTAISAFSKSGGYPECLKLVNGAEKLASRLESRRYAAYLGCTTEFRKMEGATYNEDSGTIFLSIAEVGRGMEDRGKKGKPNDKYDLGSGNVITLPYNKCGCIYELSLNDNYFAKKMKAAVCGSKTVNSTLDPDNYCDVNGISAPDNVASMQGYKAIIIAEDGSGHVNNALWKYNLEEKTLERLATVPTYAEISSPYFYPDINGFSYLTFSNRNEEYDDDKKATLEYFVWKTISHDDDVSPTEMISPNEGSSSSDLSGTNRLTPFSIVSVLCFYALSYAM